nr:hypothetical protein [Tanacetum cinerariifolium]
MALPPSDQRHPYLRFEGLEYTDADIVDFKMTLGKIYSRKVHKVLVLDFESLPAKMDEGLTSRMLMEHRDAQGQSVFTSRAWRRLFEVRGLLVFELIMDFFSTFRFGEVILNVDVANTLQFRLGGARRRMSWRRIILGLGLHTTKEMQTTSFALGPERQPDVVAGALVDAGGTLDMLARVEEEVHEILASLGKQRKVMDDMATDLSRFTVWAAGGISQLLDSTGATYVWIWYDDDVHDLIFVEIEFTAIVFNVELTSEEALSCEPTVRNKQEKDKIGTKLDKNGKRGLLFKPRWGYDPGKLRATPVLLTESFSALPFCFA